MRQQGYGKLMEQKYALHLWTPRTDLPPKNVTYVHHQRISATEPKHVGSRGEVHIHPKTHLVLKRPHLMVHFVPLLVHVGGDVTVVNGNRQAVPDPHAPVPGTGGAGLSAERRGAHDEALGGLLHVQLELEGAAVDVTLKHVLAVFPAPVVGESQRHLASAQAVLHNRHNPLARVCHRLDLVLVEELQGLGAFLQGGGAVGEVSAVVAHVHERGGGLIQQHRPPKQIAGPRPHQHAPGAVAFGFRHVLGLYGLVFMVCIHQVLVRLHGGGALHVGSVQGRVSGLPFWFGQSLAGHAQPGHVALTPQHEVRAVNALGLGRINFLEHLLEHLQVRERKRFPEKLVPVGTKVPALGLVEPLAHAQHVASAELPLVAVLSDALQRGELPRAVLRVQRGQLREFAVGLDLALHLGRAVGQRDVRALRVRAEVGGDEVGVVVTFALPGPAHGAPLAHVSPDGTAAYTRRGVDYGRSVGEHVWVEEVAHGQLPLQPAVAAHHVVHLPHHQVHVRAHHLLVAHGVLQGLVRP
mmetsp:Transcript_43940/g.83907  ORF Transcript_43940/g.83907 Transcript_43940/m.83907 type:complete len:524 (-) Transcript_43940:620-2191(-)